MGRALKWVKSGNLVHYYVRETQYDGFGMREEHKGAATLGDVAELAKQSRHVLQIMGFFFALIRRLVQGGGKFALTERRKNLLVVCYFGIPSITSLTILHAEWKGLNPERVLDDLYLAAFRKTIAELKLEGEKAIGIPLGGTVPEKNLKIDNRDRVTLPKWFMESQIWRPGKKLRIVIEENRVYLEPTEQTQQGAEADRTEEIISTKFDRIFDIVDHFMSNLCYVAPVGEEDLRRATEEDAYPESRLAQSNFDRIRDMIGVNK